VADKQLLQDSQQFAFNCFSSSENPDRRAWFAAFTAPQAEQSVARHLAIYGIESFLPTFESTHVWKNRQKKKIMKPMFPSYVFVHLDETERRKLFRVPNVVKIIGGKQGPIPIPTSEIEFLRSMAFDKRLTPSVEFAPGQRVRIKDGPMRGIEGTLIRHNNKLRFVLTLQLMNKHVAIEVVADEIEPIS
jgi:transcription antitermination factor NusG